MPDTLVTTPSIRPASDGASPHRLAELLTEARARTLLLIGPVSEGDLRAQHDPLMGPILWDLGHIAHFEELWLLDNLRGEIGFSEMPGMFNPFDNPRAVRGELPLPALRDVLELLANTRTRVLQALEAADLGPDAGPLLAGGFVYHLVLQHEYQHNETMLQTLQLKRGEPYAAPRAVAFAPPVAMAEPGAMVRFPGGEVTLGVDDHPAAYDNERPRRTVRLEPFHMDVMPVTRADYLRFMDDGGYRRRELWSEQGWAWLQEAGVEAPKYWTRESGGWRVRHMDRMADAEAPVPVCHVCWYEADAYARWAGKRLPTEPEWEAAASWDTAAGRARLYPWGDTAPGPLDANLDQLAFEPAPVGTYPRNVSPLGCYGMLGDVWEWTASTFEGHEGFRAFPYPEYSEVFFGSEHRVLRGGAWATRAGAVRNTFRNWDYPIRRQIFSGFRCARDD